MYVQSLLAGALITTTAAAAEPMVFHTAYFPDATAVNLSVADKTLSADGSYDFDVMIRLTEVDAAGAVIYEDSVSHGARVRCSAPAKVLVGGLDYAVGATSVSPDIISWKEDLWRTVCGAPVS
ncbi:hypothetical protein [Chelativorans intermedius]|uniref:Uncharacterized protein n=1 Tax=Chelativorans intermedius TaxID=515947 RepID=A0ABV6DC58_9HYPH|nr:hypothetical protein [Chelativorans intermedius]MCT9000324.1 hypothetical protein [Chelativorans intermedius]